MGTEQDNIIPRFYLKPIRNNFLSKEQQREVYEDKEYVELIIPGDRNAIVHEAVKDHHRDRWPDRYRAWKESREAPVEGTPIEEWSVLGASQVMEFKSHHVRTVEQFASLSDGQLQAVCPMGGFELRKKAQQFVSGQTQAEARIAELEAKLEALMADKVKEPAE